MRNEIVIITRSLPLHRLGGMETVTWDLAKEFVRQGQVVHVITTSSEDGRSKFELDGVRVAAIPGTPAGRYSNAWWTRSRSYFEERCVQSARAVLSVSAAGFGLLPLKARLRGVPFVMQAHGTSWGEIVSKWRSRRIRSIASSVKNMVWLTRDLLTYRKFDAVVAVGERVYASLLTAPVSWCTRRDAIHLINNGIDCRIFHPDPTSRHEIRKLLAVDERAPVVISAHRLHAQKGTHLCLAAVAELVTRLPDVRYVIAGDGPERRQLERLAHRLGIAERVSFLGKINREELAGWLRGADALLFLTTREEGLPLNLLEALASGLHVVVSDHVRPFASSAIHPVSPHDPKGVSDTLVQVLRTAHGCIPTARLPETFDIECAARRYLSLLGAG